MKHGSQHYLYFILLLASILFIVEVHSGRIDIYKTQKMPDRIDTNEIDPFRP